MSSTPVPANLLLLPTLPSTPRGTKVRFLGYVCTYVPSTGRLHLQHPPSTTTVLVDISHTDAKASDLAVRAWVNVIGYVEDLGVGSSARSTDPIDVDTGVDAEVQVKGKTEGEGEDKAGDLKGQSERKGDALSESVETAKVQAVMLWSAGAVDVKAYDSGIRGRMRVDRAVRDKVERQEDGMGKE